jgi:hypothetical protein
VVARQKADEPASGRSVPQGLGCGVPTAPQDAPKGAAATGPDEAGDGDVIPAKTIRQVFSRVGLERTGHTFNMDPDIVDAGRVDLFCRDCHGEWWLDVSHVNTPQRLVEMLFDLASQMPPCRRRPLYVPIPGTPWFEYLEHSRKAERRP